MAIAETFHELTEGRGVNLARHGYGDHDQDREVERAPAKGPRGRGGVRGARGLGRVGETFAEGCDRAHNPTEVLVEYSAQYLFYGPASAER